MSNGERLYHVSLGLPEGFVKPTGRVALRWTYHATKAAQEDRYGIIRRFKSATLDRLEIIEVGMVGNDVSKILFRGRYTDKHDVCMVLIPSTLGQPWTVKTVWMNEIADTHSTLDASKYVC